MGGWCRRLVGRGGFLLPVALICFSISFIRYMLFDGRGTGEYGCGAEGLDCGHFCDCEVNWVVRVLGVSVSSKVRY